MKVKKYIIGLMTCSMLLGVSYFKPVKAIDFSKNETKYMSLCASGSLTNSNKKTCESFNTYLKEKNKKLKKELNDLKIENEILKKAMAIFTQK